MSENSSDDVKKRERPNLTDYQKHLIVFLAEELNYDINKIREHDKLRTEDGKPMLKKTVIYWLNRFKETGDLKVKERSGRPRLLNEIKERRLIKYIQNNSNKDYTVIKEKLKLNMTRRTINNYALRNQIMKDGKTSGKKMETKNVEKMLSTSLPKNCKSNTTVDQKKLSERRSRRSLANGESVKKVLNTQDKQNVSFGKKLSERRSRRSIAGDENVAINRSFSSKKK